MAGPGVRGELLMVEQRAAMAAAEGAKAEAIGKERAMNRALFGAIAARPGTNYFVKNWQNAILILSPGGLALSLGDLKGEVAIASAKKAYEIYKRVFSGPRWEKLAAEGAQPQRLLWASTSSKNPAFKDTKYVEALIGADTVDTVPLETIEAFRDHGVAADTLELDLDKATETLDRLKAAGIDIDKITQQLEDEGVDKFNKPFEKLLQAIEDEKNKA